MILFTVLNPSIRMSWIRKHWDQEYISLAEEKIRQTVRHFQTFVLETSHSFYIR